ncbi:MAG: phosphate acetyltransferase [Phycisphaerae bacterium]|nr:phosphate acetyltransferase [Phycisphaerae bacterium]NIP53729.1 phosphate acetyltransferase [Phycisphaerae bacterium]NIS52651.1 phosphate acetyltransferase [Phycisphaerae bacterium]NIU10130.1 phosphate acetyltransferase [Phycisphaerae bacterium]NIV02724.1 phosphate acetyltransferase [Phycisphaerae bacterium]
MDIIGSFKEKARGKKLSVVLPEGRDERIIQAARRLKDEDLAQPIVLGSPEQLEAAIDKAGVDLAGIETINPKESDKLDFYAKEYSRRRDEISAAVAKRIVAKPLFYAGMMVACGDADVFVGGVASATSILIQAGVLTIGLRAGFNTPSSYFIMVVPNFEGKEEKTFIYADCAVNIDPTAEQLADIALASAASARGLLGEEPRVALLSFSTRGSAFGPSVDRVKEALKIARAREPELAIDGEFQADSAIIPRVAAKKVKDESAVAGKANVIIFPDLDSGNIAYKLTQYMAGAQAIGPFLQGFAKPITDLSRGASVETIISAVVLTLGQVPEKIIPIQIKQDLRKVKKSAQTGHSVFESSKG